MQVAAQSADCLTPFQRNKLAFDFNTFFDLNNDGVLSYKGSRLLHIPLYFYSGLLQVSLQNSAKISFVRNIIRLCCTDFQWAKDRICQLSGWRQDCDKYRATERLFTSIWTSLVTVADQVSLLILLHVGQTFASGCIFKPHELTACPSITIDFSSSFHGFT